MKKVKKDKQVKLKGKLSLTKSNEALFSKLGQKFDMSQKEICEHYKKFLQLHPSGEMGREEFVEYAEKEKHIKTVVAESLFR